MKDFEEFLMIVVGPYIFTGETLILALSILAVIIKLIWFTVSLMKNRRL